MSGAPGYSDAKRAAQAAAAGALARGEGPAEAARAAIAATDAFFETIRKALNLDALLARTACRAGCFWCCCQIVGVTAAELALVAEAIAAMPPSRQAAIQTRVRDVMNKGRGLDPAQWWAAQIRCPLLDDDNRCAVHAHRPMTCRGYNSADADLCRRSFEGEQVRPPVLAAQHGVWGHAQSGLAEALAAAGTAPGPIVLAEGVERLFTSPSAP